MDKPLEEVAFQINNSDNKMIIVAGSIDEFDAHSFGNGINKEVKKVIISPYEDEE